MSEWQPIESAPTEGRVLLFVTEYIYSWKHYPMSHGRWEFGYYDQETEHWRAERRHDEDDPVGFYLASHWMPEPKNPA